MTTTTTIAIPLKLGAALNARVHWTARAKRAKTERAIVRVALGCHRRPMLSGDTPPTTCTLTRIAPRALDDDNLAGAFKSIRDEVAFFWGVDDGPKGPIAWHYAQRKGEAKQYGIEIKLEWRDG
jgi:hypothetical protein